MEGDFPRRGFDSQNLHRNKRSLTLDLKSPRGIEIIHKLVPKADVVVENFRPDVKTRLGIDYETLSRINPRLVYGSISGFGQDGPYRDRPGYDQIAQGMGGLMSITGLPGQGPVRVGIPVADLTAGIFLAQGILVALLERERSGKGQWVHTSLLQAMVTMLDFQASRWLIGKEIPPQAGNDHPTAIPTGVFKTADGHLNIAASGQHMFRRLCETLGTEPLLEDPRFRSAPDRSKNRKALAVELEKAFGTAHHPGVGRAAQHQGRAVRPHPRRQAGLRERADPASQDGGAGEASRARRAPRAGPAGHALPHPGSASARPPPTPASTPTRSWPSSATPRPTSPPFATTRSSDRRTT